MYFAPLHSVKHIAGRMIRFVLSGKKRQSIHAGNADEVEVIEIFGGCFQTRLVCGEQMTKLCRQLQIQKHLQKIPEKIFYTSEVFELCVES